MLSTVIRIVSAALALSLAVVPTANRRGFRRRRRPTSCCSTARSSPSTADFSIHEAVAIIGDRIMAVGNDDQMKTVAGPATRMIDLKGRAVIPGLMDNHLHGAGGGPGVDLSRARSMADVNAALQARVRPRSPAT